MVNPITQRYDIISLRSRQVMMTAVAQSKNSVTLNVEAVALVKIGSTSDLVRAAAERFAGQDSAVEQFTQDQLDGALRGIIAQQDVVDLMQNRQAFAEQIAQNIAPELKEQGLVLDSFQIKGITDSDGYIQSLGAPEIEARRREAEIARAAAEREIQEKNTAVEEQNLTEFRALEINKAEAERDVKTAQAEAQQAESLIRAEREQQVRSSRQRTSATASTPRLTRRKMQTSTSATRLPKRRPMSGSRLPRLKPTPSARWVPLAQQPSKQRPRRWSRISRRFSPARSLRSCRNWCATRPRLWAPSMGSLFTEVQTPPRPSAPLTPSRCPTSQVFFPRRKISLASRSATSSLAGPPVLPQAALSAKPWRRSGTLRILQKTDLTHTPGVAGLQEAIPQFVAPHP